MLLRFHVVLVGFIYVLIGSPAHGETTLRWKLVPDAQLLVSFEQQLEMQTALAGQKMHSQADLGIELLWKVREVSPAGDAQIEQTIERVRLGMTSPGYEPVSYDSREPEAPNQIAETIGKTVKPLLGLGFVQRMDAMGQIHEVRLANPAQTANAAAAAQLNQSLSQEGLRDLLTQAAATLPEHAVKPGDQWDRQTETNSPVGKLLMDVTYTYRGQESIESQTLERIDVSVDMKFDKGPNAMEMEVAVAEQLCEGVVYFDNQAGRLVRSKITRRIVTETKISDQVHRHVVDTTMHLRFHDGTNIRVARQH